MLMLLAMVIHLMQDGPMDELNWTPRLENDSGKFEIEKQKQKNKQTVSSSQVRSGLVDYGVPFLYHTILFNF